MAAALGLALLTVCALITTVSWSVEARSRMLVEREHATALAGFGALGSLAAAVALATGNVVEPAVTVLELAAAVAAVIGVVGVAGLATPTAGLGPAAAEAALVGGSLVSVLWVVTGSPDRPGATTLALITMTTLDLTTAALIVRIPVVSPLLALDRRYRPVIGTGVAALCCLGVADGLLTVHQVRTGVPAGVGLAVRAVAYLLASAVPWVPERATSVSSGRVGRGRIVVRALPYVLVGMAVAALFGASLAGRGGPVPLALVMLVVAGLAAVRAVGVRDNARLVRDLQSSRRRWSALVENATDVILGIDTLGRVESANAAVFRLLQRAPGEMTGLDVGELAVAADRPRLRRAVDDVVHGRVAADRIEIRLAPPATGSAELRLAGVPEGAVANLSDTTEAVRLRERLERLARYDEMTGLANRAYLLGEMTAWLRDGLPVTALYCDLDGFKAVNDRFGHLRGDEVLAEAARRLGAAAQGLAAERTVVARIGGDEFVVALVRAGEAEIATATDRLLDAMRPTFAVADRAVGVGLSIGVATSGDEPSPSAPGSQSGRPLRDARGADPDAVAARGADDLLHRADVAMFAAKQAGRFRWVRWEPRIQARALRRVDIAIGLRRALDNHRLALAYQPLVRLTDGVVIGVEALLRVAPEDDGPGALAGLPEIVSPAELVAVAEDTGEIIEMGQWVLQEATQQAARWRESGYDVLTTVNVSVRQMATEGFVGSVLAALTDAGLPSKCLALEITEGQLLAEGDPAWAALQRLRAAGVMLVIDDFGSGYSSLAYLRRMPVRGVKLDRGLLEGLTSDVRARTVARGVISVARALGLLVVAEGLETVEATRIVRDMGAYAGQGFALFEAMPADAVTKVLGDVPTRPGGGPRRGGAPDPGPGALSGGVPRGVPGGGDLR